MRLLRQTDLPTDYLISRVKRKRDVGVPTVLVLNELGVILHTTISVLERDEVETAMREVLSDVTQHTGNRAVAFFYFKLPNLPLCEETEKVVTNFENEPANADAVNQMMEAIRQAS
jgi:hypothetical protein